MNIFLKNFTAMLLIAAIALFPSFVVGKISTGKTIELRIEDFLIVILLLISFSCFLFAGKYKIQKPPLLNLILFWLSLAFISGLINVILGNLIYTDRAFFYFLKYAELALFYFYIFCQIKDIDSAKFLAIFFIFCGLVNVGYVVYQAVSHHRFGEYGAAAISESGVFPAGALFLIFFIFSLNIFLYYYLDSKKTFVPKNILALLAVAPSMGVFGSASKTNLLALIFSLLLTIFLFFFKKKNLKHAFIIFLVCIVIGVIFLYSFYNIRDVERLSLMLNPGNIAPNYDTGRWSVIKPIIHYIIDNPQILIIGYGVGFITEAHNQFVRNLAEIGLPGSILFLMLIFVILKISFNNYFRNNDNFSAGMSAGLLVSTLAMLFCCLATDPFIVVKPASVYWVFAAITMSAISFGLKNNPTNAALQQN